MNKELETIFQLSSDAVVCVKDGNVCFANAAAEKLFGSRILSLPVSAVIPSQPSADSAYTCRINGKSCSVNSVSRFDMLIYYIKPEAEADTEYSFISDIFINNIMSNLSAMNLIIELMQNQDRALAASQVLARYIPRINHCYFSMKRLLCNLAAAYSLSSGSMPFIPKPTDLVIFCSNVVTSVSTFIKDKAELKFSTELDRLYAYVDTEKVERILLNLISNSLDSMDDGGTIEISLKKDGDMAVFTVSDKGCGIPAEIMSTLFCRYRYVNMNDLTKMPSPGLGLYISKGFAALHGGSIMVESKEGQGSSVHLLLPIQNDGVNIFFDHDPPCAAKRIDILLTELANHIDNSFYSKESHM